MNEQTSIDNINSTVFVFLLACPFLGFSRKELFACEGIDLLKSYFTFRVQTGYCHLSKRTQIALHNSRNTFE